MTDVKVGLVGLGYWGRNLARNLHRTPGCELRWCCDASHATLEEVGAQLPGARLAADVGELLEDPELDAVALATDVPTHAPLATRVLEAGKHCFVEKPLTQTTADAEALAEQADAHGLVLMVGHLLEYHPGVVALKELIDRGELGERLYYLYGNRVNLGKIRKDENALWSLGAHDVSVVLRLVGEEPVEVSAQGAAFVDPPGGVEDVVFCYLRFPSGIVAHLHLSWLDPHKERRFTVVGSGRMATFDDQAPEQKLVVYDKGFDVDADAAGEFRPRSGDVHVHAVSTEEPLAIECRHFVECVRDGTRSRSDGQSGVRVVRVLEALQRSLEAGGAAIEMEPARQQ